MTAYHAGTRPPRDGEHVRARCWCDRGDVWVAIEDVRRGQTGKCYRKDCLTWTGRDE